MRLMLEAFQKRDPAFAYAILYDDTTCKASFLVCGTTSVFVANTHMISNNTCSIIFLFTYT